MSVDTSEKPAQVPMPAAPQREHQWLQRLVGEWTSETEMTMEQDKPSEKFTGTERVRPVGDLWVLGESEGQMPGGPGSSVVLLGFDPAKGHYVGTWAGSMMPNLWVYDGRLNGNALTLESEGPNFEVPGKTAKYRDIIEIKSDDHRTLRSQMQGDDGQWHDVPMIVRYWRKRA